MPLGYNFQIMRKLLRFPFFAFLAGVFPGIALWNFNKSQVYPRDVLVSLGVTLLFVLAVCALTLLIYRSSIKAAIASAIFFILFFSFGHVYELVEQGQLSGLSIGFVKLTVVYLVLMAAGFWFAAKVKKVAPSTILLLNGIFALLVVLNLVQISAFEVARRKAEKPVKSPQSTGTALPAGGGEEVLADIYYIILDAYSRQDVLLDRLGVDNSEFIAALRSRGFFVADCANSNYGETLSSMLSSLNYSYIEPGNPADSPNMLDLKNNKIRAALKAYGYQFVSSRAFSSETDINNADIYLNYRTDQGMKDTMAQAQFAEFYLETTLLRTAFELYRMDPVRYDILPGWLFVSNNKDDVLGYASYWYYQTRYMFDTLEEFPQKDGNYLIYAHINTPHGPYVFDRNGNFRYTYNPKDDAPYYIDQVLYLNQRVIEMIDAILERSDVQPIIILQADHGAHVITTGLEKHKILNAYALPGQMNSALYDTITPVNTFRLILRDYFKQDIDLLPDTIVYQNGDKLEEYPSSCEIP